MAHFPVALLILALASGSVPALAQGPALAPNPAASKDKKATPKPPPAPSKKKKKKKDPDDGEWIEGGGDAKGRDGKRGGKGVRAQFEAAQKLYDIGKYGEALSAFDALVRKYPDNEPARVQLAKTLYRLDRIKDSYAVFARVDPQHLDPETSYEYGWAFYMAKQYQGALYGFQRVPKGHALFDLANYYGAICAIKLRKYEDAEDMLEKAVVLPDKLAKSRALYIKHVAALRLMKEKGTLAKERGAELDALNKQLAKEKGMGKGDPTGAAAKSDKPAGYAHQGMMFVDRFANVTYTVEHQYQDFHGLAEKNFDAKIAGLDLRGGPVLPIPGIKQGKDRFAAFGLELTLAAEDRVEHGKEQRVLADETNEDLTRVAARDLGITDTKSGDVGARTWLEFPLPEGVWVAVQGGVTFHYPEFERGGRTGSRSGGLQIGGKNGLWTYYGNTSYAEILTPKTKPQITVVKTKADVVLTLPSKLSAEFFARYTMNDYLNEENATDGPDSIGEANLLVAQTLPGGFYAGLGGFYQAQQNFLFHKIPTFGQVSADGAVTSGKALLGVTPTVIPWLNAEISEQVQKTNWALGNEEAREPFELNTVDYIEKFVGKVSVNLAF